MEGRVTKTVRHPVMKLMIDFNNVGYEKKDEWIDITDDVLDISGSKEKSGRQLGSVVSDVATFTVDNINKKFSNDNKNSPFYKKIKSNLRFRLLTGFKGETLIPYASGYVESFTPSWKEKKILIKTTDYFKLFKKTNVPEDSFQDVSWDELVNILCDHVGLPDFIVRHIPQTEFYYNYFKFEEEDCFEALKGLMEVAVGEAFFEQEEFFVKTKLALDYKFDDVPDHDITVDELLDFDENVDSQTIINTVTLSSEYKSIAPLEVVFETPDNVVKVENEQIIYKDGNSIYVNEDNLPLINNDENPISVKNITQGRTIYIKGHDPMTGKIDIHPESLANLHPNDILAVSYSYQQLALLAGKQRKYTFSLKEEVDSLQALDIAVWDEKGDAKRDYSENADTPNTVSRQSMTFDQKGNSVTLILKNNYDSPVTISTLQLRGYPIKSISPIEVFVRDLPSIKEYGKQEVTIQNNYINNVKLAEKIAQYIVDNNKDNRKRISIEIAGYPEFTLDDISQVTEESSGTSHKFTNDRIDYSFNIDSGWSVKAELTELDSKPWVYESFKGESWEKTNPGTPDSDFLTDINANLIKNGGAELYTGTADYEDVGAISQKHIVPDYWHFTRTSGNATARIRDGGNLVLHGLHSFEITTSDGGSGYFEQIVNSVKTESTYILSFVASVDSSSGKASILQYDGETLLKSDSIDIKNSDTYELMISSLSKTNTLVIRIEKLEGTGSESLIFDKVKLENAKEKTPYIESEETSAVQIGQRYANSLTIGNNYGIEIFDENNTSRVRLGQYQPGKYGLLVLGGAIEVIGGLPEDQIDPEATNKWNDASTWIDNYADDNSLSPVEKRDLTREWSIIKSEYDGAILQSNAYWESTQKLPERDQLTIDYYKLYNYLFVTPDEPNGKPILDDDNMDNNSDINRAEYNTLFSNFYESLSTLHTLIVDRAKVIADNAEAVGQAAQQTAADAEAKGDAAAKAAEEAKDAATKAQSDATSAVTSANNAVNTANKAAQDAQDAIDKAQDGFDAAQDALSKADAAVDTANNAKQVASDAATQASTANTNAQTAMSNAQDAINQAKAANDNANTREKSIIKSNTAPSNPATDQLWIDTSKTPQIMRRWNGSTWVDLSPTQANQIGAVSTTTYTTDISNINNTLSQKASITTVNTLSGRVDSAETAITQNANAISSKADKTVVDTLKNTVDNHSTLISQNADAIALKANASTVDTLTGRVSTAEATLKTQADQIAARITKTDADAKYATQTALTATANSLTSSISAVQTNLDNLQIGGRNLIKNSDFSNGFTSWREWNPGTSTNTIREVISDNTMPGFEKVVHLSADAASQGWGFAQDSISVLPNTTYTYSFWYKFISEYGKVAIQISNGSAGFPTNFYTYADNLWHRATITITTGADVKSVKVYAGVYGESKSGEVYITGEKLEVGNKATDWTPAPEDMATVVQFNTLSQTLDSTMSRIGNAEGNISALQQTSDSFATRISNAEGNISSLTQTTNGLQTTVSGKVDKTTYNSFVTQTNTALQSKLSVQDAASTYATQSSLTQTANSLTSKITSVQTNLDSLSIGGRNYILNSTLDDVSNWALSSGVTVDSSMLYNNHKTIKFSTSGLSSDKWLMAKPHLRNAKAGEIYSAGAWFNLKSNTMASDDGAYLVIEFYDSSNTRIAYWNIRADNTVLDKWQYVKSENRTAPTNTAYVTATAFSKRNGTFWVADMTLNKGTKVSDWSPAPEDMATQSQISQLASDINLRVQKGDVINQINVSTEGILIDGKKVHITGQTTIDNAVIKDAMIQSMTANKLTAGTIDANVITVKNINASNIVTGTLDASKATVANIDASKITTGTLSAARIAAGSIDASKINVSSLSALSANLGNITGGSININNNFIVDKNGNLTANNGTFIGDIRSVSDYAMGAEMFSGGLYTVYSSNSGSSYTGEYNTGSITIRRYPIDIPIDKSNIYKAIAENSGKQNYETRISAGQISLYAFTTPGDYLKSKTFNIETGTDRTIMNSNNNITISAYDDLRLESENIYLTPSFGKVYLGDTLNIGNNIDLYWDSVNNNLVFSKGIKSGNVLLNGYNSIRNENAGLYLQSTYNSVEIKGNDVKLDVGTDSSGPRIYSPAFSSRTYTNSSNAYITDAGVIGKTSSARKYKLDEQPVSDDLAYKILDVVPKTWFDKKAVETYSELLTKQANGEKVDWDAEDVPYIERIPGVVAEDVEDAGLSQYVIYSQPDENGNRNVESVMYDRLWTLLIPVVKDHNERLSIVEEQNNNLLLKVASLELELANIKQKLGDA